MGNTDELCRQLEASDVGNTNIRQHKIRSQVLDEGRSGVKQHASYSIVVFFSYSCDLGR